MISLSKITSDNSIYGNVIFQEYATSEMTESEARLVVVPTLDGESVLLRSGVAETDRQLRILARVTESQAIVLNAIFRSEARLILSWATSVYIVSIKRIKTDNGNLNMLCYIDEQEI